MIEQGKAPWWRGARGEWWVAAQLVLMLLVFLGPRNTSLLPRWPPPVAGPANLVGVALMLLGSGLLLAAALRLGRNLTPLPRPQEGGALRQTGAYGIVRHPMYAGGVAFAYGFALVVHGWLTLVYATALLVFADVKATREERWLVAAYPGYADYRQRTSKLIPFIR